MVHPFQKCLSDKGLTIKDKGGPASEGAPAHAAQLSGSGEWAWPPVLLLWAAAVEMQELGLGSHDCRIRATFPQPSHARCRPVDEEED